MTASTTQPKTAYFRRVADDLIIGVPVDSPEFKRARTEMDPETAEKLFEPCERPKGGGVHQFRPPKADAAEARIAALEAKLEQALAGGDADALEKARAEGYAAAQAEAAAKGKSDK